MERFQGILEKLPHTQMFVLLLIVGLIVILALIVLIVLIIKLPAIIKDRSIKFEIK